MRALMMGLLFTGCASATEVVIGVSNAAAGVTAGVTAANSVNTAPKGADRLRALNRCRAHTYPEDRVACMKIFKAGGTPDRVVIVW